MDFDLLWTHNSKGSAPVKIGLHAGIPLILATFSHSESTAKRRQELKLSFLDAPFVKKRLQLVSVDTEFGFVNEEDDEDSRKWGLFLFDKVSHHWHQ